ncbi:hypothetical protein HD554DRAFT_816870 [Boletus coccyginus]|nr:hypothetical protein HD554DRAFT_816870 [Boletus coccyginus]
MLSVMIIVFFFSFPARDRVGQCSSSANEILSKCLPPGKGAGGCGCQSHRVHVKQFDASCTTAHSYRLDSRRQAQKGIALRTPCYDLSLPPQDVSRGETSSQVRSEIPDRDRVQACESELRCTPCVGGAGEASLIQGRRVMEMNAGTVGSAPYT